MACWWLAALGVVLSAARLPAAEPARLPWGIYQIHWQDEQFRAGLDQELAMLGGHPAYVLDFRDLNRRRGFPAGMAAAARERHLTPIISLELWTWGHRRDGGDAGVLEAIGAGDYDDYFAEWAKEAASYSDEVVLRFGFEMNGDWFPWGQKPEAFKAAWRRVRAIFDKAQATNVRWMFSPNILYGDQTPATGIEAYYPGDDMVDLLGIDGYNFGDHHDQWHHWQSFREVFGSTIDALVRHPKPLMLSEVGCADDARKAAWLSNFLAEVSADRRLAGFVWFNLDKRREGEPDWRLQSDAESLEVFKRWAGP
jgi:hypothetical protein